MTSAPSGTPVWVRLPGRDDPLQAAVLTADTPPRFVYLPSYRTEAAAIPLDPIELRLVRQQRGVAVTAACLWGLGRLKHRSEASTLIEQEGPIDLSGQ